VLDLEHCRFNNQFPIFRCSASFNYKVLLTLLAFISLINMSDKFLWSRAIYSATTIMFYSYFFLFLSFYFLFWSRAIYSATTIMFYGYYGRALFIALRPLCFTVIMVAREQARAATIMFLCCFFVFLFLFLFLFFFFFFFLFSLLRNL
jgi:hypothetical protein